MLSPRIGALSPSVRGEWTEMMAVDLVSEFIPFIIGNATLVPLHLWL